MSALLGQRPGAFKGSRVGELTPVRAALIAICADVMLSPLSALAWLFCLTPRGAAKCADRGRRMLLTDPRARAQLSAALRPLLELELPR
ncbi:MAG: hypothetical protein H6746_21100 [Deltaproteobacteria bacterium]|nr:hypothetical protein [Deltaproteobacteria bacterium]